MLTKSLKNIKTVLDQRIVTLKLYWVGQGTKVLILMFMYFFIIFTAILVCIFSIVHSDEALFNEGKNFLVLTAQNEARKEEQELLKIEKSLDDLSSFIKVTFDINKFDDTNYIQSYKNDLMLPAVKQFFQTTKNAISMYAYLDIEKVNSSNYVAAVSKSKKKLNFKVYTRPSNVTDPAMSWYYDTIKTQHAEWLEPYWNSVLGKVIISYVKPVYKDDNNKQTTFIGVTGVDITSDKLLKSISNIKLYKNGYAFLVSKDYYFIASKDYSIKDNLFSVNNGYYKPLLKEVKNKHSGIIKFDNNLIAFSRLHNGYNLFVVVSESELFGHVVNFNLILITFTVLAVFIATCIMLSLLKKLFRMMNSLETSDNIIMTIANSIEAKDEYTKGHIQRVTLYTEKMAKYFKLSSENMEILKKASMLHDIGKIGVPDRILNKPGKLTKEEFDEVKKHTIYGSYILKPLTSYTEMITLIRHHHEKLDGSGYPDGLKGDEINLLTRILTIIDIYDALVTERPYKKAFSNEEALKILDEEVEKGYLDRKVLEGLKFILKNTAKL